MPFLRLSFATLLALATAGQAAEITAAFTSAATVPVTAASYTATGNTVNPSLGFAPAVGTNLTVVNNTGLAFISGMFGNLTQGQTVDLIYNGVSYRFVANYFGGTGNDLVLQWANHRLAGWGRNADWQLGDGGNTTGYAPVPVDAMGILAGKTILAGSIGDYRNLVLCSDGTLAAWGSNRIGSVGFTSSNVPVAVDQSGVLAGKTVIAVACGRNHSLALCSDGTLASWGFNNEGQLGSGSSNANIGTVPVLVDRSGVLAGKSIVAIRAGTNFSVVLCSDGTLASWGSNSFGELGDNSTFQKNQPVLVNTSGVLASRTPVAIAAGGLYTLALCSDGALVAWGSNSNGALGNNSTTGSRVPVLVTIAGTALEGKTIVSLSAGGGSSYALASDNTLLAWGFNYPGQLGLGDTTSRNTAVVVPRTGVISGKTIASIHSGSLFFRMHFTDGTAATCGDNTDGQLGHNSPSTTSRSSPVLVNTGALKTGERFVGGYSGPSSRHNLAVIASPPAAIVTTHAATAITDAGAALHGSVNPNLTAVNVAFEYGPTHAYGNTVAASPSALSGNTETAASATIGGLLPGTTYHFRAIATSAGGISYGAHQTFTTTITGPPEVFHFDSASTVPLTVGDYEATGRTAEFKLHFTPLPGTALTAVENTGSGPIRGTFANLPQGKIVRLAHAGISYDFAATYFGGSGNDLVLTWAHTRLLGWGINTGQQLGTGLPGAENRLVPTPVDMSGILAGKSVIATASTIHDSVALCADGTLATWGSASPVPVLVNNSAVLSGKTPVAITAGATHFLVLCADGTLAAWGSNTYGQFGNNSTTSSLTVPVAVDQSGVLAGKTPVAIAAGEWFSLALCSDGTLAAWGSNNHGRLGDNTTTQRRVPVLVNTTTALAGKRVVAIACGYQHSLALCSDGTMATWGNNPVGQLGNNTTTLSYLPVSVNLSGILAGKSVVAIDAGQDNNLVLCSDGTLAGWGGNTRGQLGIASTTPSSVPVAVTRSGVLNGKTVTSIVSGLHHNMALCSDGTLASWGSNSFGFLGDNSTTQSGVPVLVNTGMLRSGERFSHAFTDVSSFHSFAVAYSPPPPAVTALAASLISSHNATLNGSVNAAGASTTISFEYGLTDTYGTTVAASPSTASGSTTTAVSKALSGLVAGTIYHFRVVATNANGTSRSADMTFTTNHTPVFAGYGAATPFNTAATISLRKLLANATDPDGDALAVSTAGPVSGNGGTAALLADSIRYTPRADFSGADTFLVTITDSRGASVAGAFTVTVGAAPSASGSGSLVTNPPALSVLPGGGMKISFQGIPGRSYIVQRSIGGLDNWTTLATIVANASGEISYTDDAPAPGSAFYRLGLP